MILLAALQQVWKCSERNNRTQERPSAARPATEHGLRLCAVLPSESAVSSSQTAAELRTRRSPAGAEAV